MKLTVIEGGRGDPSFCGLRPAKAAGQARRDIQNRRTSADPHHCFWGFGFHD